jgi:hypothetical protein
MAPVFASSARRLGKAPLDTANVGAGEPSAETDADAAVPCVNEPNELDTTEGGAIPDRTPPAKVADADPREFVAVIVKLYSGTRVGVPVTAPVVGSTARLPGITPPVTKNVGAGVPSADTAAEPGTGVPATSVVNVLDTCVGAPAWAATSPVKLAEADPATFVAVIVKL